MSKRILVPLDRSPLAERALAAALELAVVNGACVRLVHCWPALLASADLRLAREVERREDAQEYLADTAARLRREGVAVETALLSLPIVDAICEDARRWGCDLIAMTTHGRTGWHRLWLGSVADGVMRQAGIPVLLVKGDEGDGRPGIADVGVRVLVPLDGSREAESILSLIGATVGALQPAVTLLRVVRPVRRATLATANGVPLVDVDERATEWARAEARSYLEGVAATLARDLPRAAVATRVVVHDAPARAIVAASDDVELVALATHGRGATRFLFGSIADKVLRGSQAALLVTHRHETPADVRGVVPEAAVMEDSRSA